MVYHNLEKTYLILELLKKYKIIKRKKLADEINTNISYVTSSISYLRTKGYIIESIVGYDGCYEYKGKIKNDNKLNNKLNKIEVKGIKRLYKKGIKLNEIENVINTTRGSIFYHLHKQKITPNRQKFELYEDRKNKIIKMYNEGLSIKEIANNLNIDEKKACCILYRCVKGNRRKVIKNKNEILEYIKNSNESGKEIAKKFNVSQGTISNLKKQLGSDLMIK